MLGMIKGGMGAAGQLIQGAIAAKEYLDGASLTVTVNNLVADYVMLDSYICDDAEHSARALPHKDILERGESDVGIFLVNAIKGANTSFSYAIRQNGKDYLLVINYDWDSASKGKGKLLLIGAGSENKSGLVLFKRSEIDAEGVPFKVSVMITGAYLSISVLPKLEKTI